MYMLPSFCDEEIQKSRTVKALLWLPTSFQDSVIVDVVSRFEGIQILLEKRTINTRVCLRC